jgi:hypothetical protein
LDDLIDVSAWVWWNLIFQAEVTLAVPLLEEDLRVDHSAPTEVEALFAEIGREQGGLDLLVDNIWGGDALTEWDVPFWNHSLENGLMMQERAVFRTSSPVTMPSR